MLNIFIILSIPLLIYSLNFFSKSNLYKDNNQPNFCVDCKYYIPNIMAGKEFGKCKLYYDINEDDRDFLVTGIKKKIIKEYKYCSICRNDDEKCGKQGRQFINKKK